MIAFGFFLYQNKLFITGPPFAQVMAVYLLLFLIAGVNLDLMNFRQLWAALGVAVGSYSR